MLIHKKFHNRGMNVTSISDLADYLILHMTKRFKIQLVLLVTWEFKADCFIVNLITSILSSYYKGRRNRDLIQMSTTVIAQSSVKMTSYQVCIDGNPPKKINKSGTTRIRNVTRISGQVDFRFLQPMKIFRIQVKRQ